MKKLFLLIPLFLFSLLANAATVNVSPGTNALYNAYKTAAANDVLILAAGTYDETERITFNKSITIQAAADAAPIVRFVKDNQIKSGASVKFVGIKFDGSAMTGTYEYALRSYDATAGNEIRLDNCEVTGFASSSTNYFINAASASRTLDSIIITNCYFHDTKGDAVYVGEGSVDKETCQGVIVRNSTFANLTPFHSVIEVRNYNATVTDNIEVTVDHCTFYNNPTSSTDHSAIRSYKSTKVTITNCIFAHSEAYERRVTTCYGGSISNCLTYNLTKDSGSKNSHRQEGGLPVLSGNFTVDPLFTNAAAGNLTLNTESPALFAATDNSHLGDSRWWPAVPSTDFSSPYMFTGATASISGNIWKTDDANQYLYGDGEHNANYGTAQWQIHANRACYLQVILNVASTSTSTHQYKVEVFDMNNILVGEALVESGTGTSATGDITLPGIIYLPVADYRVKLSNLTQWSSATIKGITFAYAGGSSIEVPANTLGVNDALFSTNGTRANGVISFADATTGWAKWNISVTAEAFYDIDLTIKNQYGHNMTVTLYEEDGVTPVGQVTEGSTVYGENLDGRTYNLGGLYLKADNYVVKVTNATSGSDAKIVSVGFTYVGGAVQNMPGTTALSDAWFSDNGTRSASEISYSNITSGCWAKWNIAVASAGTYNVIVNIKGQYGHNYSVEFLKEGESTPIVVSKGDIDYSNDATLYANELGSVALEAANYEMKVSNAVGDAALISVTLAYAGGGTIDLPATLLPIDATFSTHASIIDGKVDFHPSDNSSAEWAKWSIHANGGFYIFAVNANNSSAGTGQTYTIKVYAPDDEEHPILNHTSSWDENAGDYVFTCPVVELAEGDYIVKVQNSTNWSVGRVVNVVANYLGGAIVTLPGALPLIDALLSTNAYRADNMLYFAPHDTGTIPNEWAKWNLHVDETAVFQFTINSTSPNGQKYQVLIKDSESNEIYKLAHTSSLGSGDKSFTTDKIYLTSGDYTLEMRNIYPYSDGHLVSITAATVDDVIIIDENAETNSVIAANNGTTKSAALIRTFRAGVYNSICLPFSEGSNTTLTKIFGEGYELLEFNDATLNGNILALNFNKCNAISHGKPYLIKPTKNVVNPVFDNRSINKSTDNNTATHGDISFIGTFIKQGLGTHPENLYLGADGNLYFSNNDVTIKGLRAYFQVDMTDPQQVIQRARIIAQEQVVTEIDLMNSPKATNRVIKAIENGQMIIIRDGIRYTIQGQIISK